MTKIINFIHSHDWLERALKTFAQAFLGVLVPEILTILNGGLRDVDSIWLILSPILISALSAGISACQNLYLQNKK